MAYEALDSLRQTLKRILKQSHCSSINQEIVSIHHEAVVLQFHLKNNPENWGEGIREATHATEEIIQYLFSEDNPLYGGWMNPTAEHWEQLRRTALNFKKFAGDAMHMVNSDRQLSPKDIIHSAGSSSQRTAATATEEVVVGFDEDLKGIKPWLTRLYPSRLQFFSIVGTGGTGKTTLAKLVYNDRFIRKHFDIRAWVTVSQDYSVASVFSDLLASLERGIPVKRAVQREIPTECLIRTYLESGRFLIVIDDMCSKKAWDDLKNVFPDTNSSSWIMLTTRLHDVAAYVDSSSPIHMMRLLDAYHSWDLLRKKVFVDELCPLELEDVGKKIVKNCGGLPLSIVVVAGILCNLPKTRHSWKQIW